MDTFSNFHDGKSVCEGEQHLLSETKEMSQSLAGSRNDDLEIPQVCLETGQDWSLEGAVDFQLRRVQNKFSNVRV